MVLKDAALRKTGAASHHPESASKLRTYEGEM